MGRFKVGDRVILIDNFESNETNSHYPVKKGQTATITYVNSCNSELYYLAEFAKSGAYPERHLEYAHYYNTPLYYALKEDK